MGMDSMLLVMMIGVNSNKLLVVVSGVGVINENSGLHLVIRQREL